MESNQLPVTSYILSLIGGIIVLLTGIIGLLWFGAGGPGWGGFGGWMSGMMGRSHGFTGGGEFGFFSILSIMGLFSGIVIIVGAVMLRARPQDHLTWGILILIFAIVSFADMGGYFIGAVLGIIGGAFAISYRPRTMTAQPTQAQQTQPQ
jgi:CDP-diglyceride synthetase